MNVSNKIDNRKKKKPQLTILFSYYNNQDTIEKSLKSILNQSFKNFEVLIFSDGSNDRSDKIVRNIIRDKNYNILFLRSKNNLGLTKRLNYLVKVARGKYIARHDADDICQNKRFEHQLNYLKKNKKIDVLGTNAIHIKNKKKKSVFMPETNVLIQKRLPFKNSIIHSSVVMLKKVLIKNKYNENFRRCQDYELWLRIKNHTNYYNLQKFLIVRNINNNQFNFTDLYFSCVARFNHINFFKACIYGLKDSLYLIIKKIKI